MAFRVKLDHLLFVRRITLTELADRIGITIANVSVLKTNKARAIRFSTLEAICRELECQPGEFAGMEYIRTGVADRARGSKPVSPCCRAPRWPFRTFSGSAR